MRTDYGIGLIGLHWVVRVMHLPGYQAAGWRVVAAAEPVAQSVADAQRDYDVGRVLGDYRELLRLPEVQVVDSSFGHAPKKEGLKLALVRAAAEAGKPLLLHKPIASTLRVAEEMVAEAAQAGLPLAVNHNARYNPAAYSIKQLLAPERLGRPGIIELRAYWKGPVPSPFNPKQAPLTFTVHHADLIRWWAGAECVSAYAKAGPKSTMTIYEFANGTVAYHMESACGVQVHDVPIRIVAEKGIVEARHNWNWHLPSAKGLEAVTVYRSPDDPGTSLPLPEHTYPPLWELQRPYYDLAAPNAGMMGSMGELMQAVHEKRVPDNDARGAVASLRMCLAAELSLLTGKPVDPRAVPPETVTAAA